MYDDFEDIDFDNVEALKGNLKKTKEVFDDNVLYSYTADDAEANGVLVDISHLAKKEGYICKVRVTDGVHSLLNEEVGYETYDLRASVLLRSMMYYIRDKFDGFKEFELCIKSAKRGQRTGLNNFVKLWGVTDTTSGPAIHVMFPEEY